MCSREKEREKGTLGWSERRMREEDGGGSSLELVIGVACWKNGSLRRGEESRKRGEEERENHFFFLGLATCSSPIRDSSINFFFLTAQ